MKDNEIKEYIVNKFYKKHVYYTDDEGKQREKTITKSHANDLFDSILLLDPTEDNKYVESIAKSFLQENKNLYSWLISAYYSNDKKSKKRLKELHNSLKNYNEYKDYFDPYQQNINNFSDIDEFIDVVNNIMDLYIREKEETKKADEKDQRIKSERKNLDILKSASVVDNKLYIGEVDLIDKEFYNIIELKEINKFVKWDIDYMDYFNENNIKIKPETLDNFVNSITKNDDSFYRFSYYISENRGGIYSIIDIEEEIHNVSINKIDTYDEFKEYISVESIFQYFSEFVPEVYEFFEASIIAGMYGNITNDIDKLYTDLHKNKKYNNSLLNISFYIEFSTPYKFKCYVDPNHVKKIYEMDKNGELKNKLEGNDLIDYVGYNFIIKHEETYKSIFKKVSNFNSGKLTHIDFDLAKEYMNSKFPELKQNLTN